MVRRVLADSGQGNKQLKPPVHCKNMNTWYKYYPLYEEGKGSNCEKKIPFLGYENELVPWGGPKIWSIQEVGTAIKVLPHGNHPHTQYPTYNPIRIPKPPYKNNFAQTPFSFWQGRQCLPWPCQYLREAGLSPQIYQQ